VAFSVGKWIQEVSNDLYKKISERTQQPTYYNKINFCTDGNDQNLNAMLMFFNKDCINYGQKIKDKEQQKIIGCHKRKVLGNMSYEKISIAHVDGLCSALRERIKFSVRKGRAFAKKRITIKELLDIYQAYNNVIYAKKGQTPCMKEKIVSKIWTWSELLHKRISILN
jgi:hypothetical protein